MIDMPVASIPVHNACASRVLAAGTDGNFYETHAEPMIEALAFCWNPSSYNPLEVSLAWYMVANVVWPERHIINEIHARYLERKYRGHVFEDMIPRAMELSYVADNDLAATVEF